MNVQNVEVGVLRALKAYKLEKGASDAAATKWAATKLNEGVARFKAVLAQVQYRLDSETGLRAAFLDLKAWAQSS